MPAEDQPRDNWLIGSWLRPAALSLVSLAGGIGTLHMHRDFGSVLAAAVCGLFAVHVWHVWYRARPTRRSQRKTD